MVLRIKIKSFAPQIMAKTRAFLREWSNFPTGHRVENVNDWLTAMTADAVVSCSMGMDMRNVERLGAKQDGARWSSVNRSEVTRRSPTSLWRPSGKAWGSPLEAST